MACVPRTRRDTTDEPADPESDTASRGAASGAPQSSAAVPVSGRNSQRRGDTGAGKKADARMGAWGEVLPQPVVVWRSRVVDTWQNGPRSPCEMQEG